MLPLVMLCIDKLIDKDKLLPYYITLCLTIIFNYYIGYMICIFSFIYFIFKIINTNNAKKKKIINFIVISLLAGLTTTFILLPSMHALLLGKANGFDSGWTKYFEINKNILSFFYNLSPAYLKSGDQAYGPAQIYTSLFIAILFILMFFNKRITKKFKISTFIILLFYILSFSFNLLDFAWQFFQKPIWWQSRYSFTFSAFLVYIGYYSFINADTLNIKTKHYISIFFSFVALITTSFIITNYKRIEIPHILFLIFSILLIIIYLYTAKNKKLHFLLIIFIIFELGINSYSSIKHNLTGSTIESHKMISNITTQTVNEVLENDSSFYRMELLNNQTFNDGLIYNYNGINYFNSVRNQKFVNFAEHQANFRVSSGASIIMDRFDPYITSMLNIKYFIGANMDYFIQKSNQKTSYTIYENPYPLSLGFIIEDHCISNKSYYENIHTMFKCMTTINDPIYIDSEEFFINKIQQDGAIIIEYKFDREYLLAPLKNNVFTQRSTIFINDEQINISYPYLMVRKDDTIKIKYNDIFVYSSDEMDFKLLDINTYEKHMDILNQNLLNIKENSTHLIEGEITTNQESILFLSIPYEEGFNIKVNGKNQEPIILFDTFLGLNLNSGENIVTIDYTPKGLKPGMIISTISCLLAIIYISKNKKK